MSIIKSLHRLALSTPVIALIIAATAIPVEFCPAGHANIDVSILPVDVLFNVVGYLPLGWALARRSTTAAITAGFAVSLLSEIIQVFSPSRFPSPIDVACNVAGTALGVVVGRWGKQPAAITVDRRAATAAAIAAVGLVVVQALPAKPATLENWDRTFQLVVGDELTHDRAWDGEIDELAIFAGALDRQSISELTQGRRIEHMPATLVFGPLRDLDVRTVRGQPLITGEQLRRFHSDIVQRGAFTLVLRVRPGATKQTGPARIVTYSHDPMTRNFALGQEQEKLVFRVRTPASGANGTFPELQTAPVFNSTREVFIAASYDGHISRVFVDGQLVGRVNISASAKMFPDLADIYLPAAAITGGMLVAVAVIGFVNLGSKSSRYFATAAAGTGFGLLMMCTGGASTLPLYDPWVPALTVTGALLCASSIE
jgi:hypothetical protein